MQTLRNNMTAINATLGQQWMYGTTNGRANGTKIPLHYTFNRSAAVVDGDGRRAGGGGPAGVPRLTVGGAPRGLGMVAGTGPMRGPGLRVGPA